MDEIFGICSRHVMANFELIKSNTFIRIVRYIYICDQWEIVSNFGSYIYIYIYYIIKCVRAIILLAKILKWSN